MLTLLGFHPVRRLVPTDFGGTEERPEPIRTSNSSQQEPAHAAGCPILCGLIAKGGVFAPCANQLPQPPSLFEAWRFSHSWLICFAATTCAAVRAFSIRCNSANSALFAADPTAGGFGINAGKSNTAGSM